MNTKYIIRKLLVASHEKIQFCRVKLADVLRVYVRWEIQWKMQKHSHNNLLSTTSISIQFRLRHLNDLIRKCTLHRNVHIESMATVNDEGEKSPMRNQSPERMIQQNSPCSLIFLRRPPHRRIKRNITIITPSAKQTMEPKRLNCSHKLFSFSVEAAKGEKRGNWHSRI